MRGAIPHRPWRRGLQGREGPVRVQHFHRQKPHPLARSRRGSPCFHPDPSRQNSPLGDRCWDGTRQASAPTSWGKGPSGGLLPVLKSHPAHRSPSQASSASRASRVGTRHPGSRAASPSGSRAGIQARPQPPLPVSLTLVAAGTTNWGPGTTVSRGLGGGAGGGSGKLETGGGEGECSPLRARRVRKG